ncbi:MAG TPA: ATP-dependent zinc metalloprotease FtsH [Acidimicrobiales bacterium]|nr:ATP-dependent zinc metalloprotease FtsH [Acidimicrobiales bacterium]
MATTSKKSNQPRRKFKKAKKSRLGLWTTIVLILLIGSYVAVLELTRPHVTGDRLRFDTYIDLIEKGQVKNAKILDQDSYVIGTYTKPDGPVAEYNAPLPAGLQSYLVTEVLIPSRIATDIDQQVGKKVAGLAAILLPGLMLVVLFGYLILSRKRGTGLFGVKSGARKMSSDAATVTFADVAGQETAVMELKEIKEFLADPERFISLGATVPKGVLLYGPPGCGKTLLARALAGESGANFYSISGSDFVEVYVGVGASRVRDLFREARENAPALIFIDELDSIGRARGGGGPGGAASGNTNSEQEQALNQILAEMDGFSPSEGILVVAATNRPDVLDQALLRPGRFDRTVGLSLPDEAARLDMLSTHAKGKVLGDDVDLGAIANKAIGLSGADLANVMNEGALLAARAKKSVISQKELEDALQRNLEAPEDRKKLALRGGRSIGKRFTDKDRVTFADVAGQEAAVAELREVKEFLANPERFTSLGAAVPKGVLLFGPPGCGKTLLARALAGEANAAFFSVGASEFVEIYVGQGASRVRDLFAEARSMAPAIIFIDEIDTLGHSRVGTSAARAGSSGEQEQALNQILAEMDGFSSSTGLIVLAATNRADSLDPALLRPGRFDRHVGLELPDESARLAILEVHAKDKVLSPAVDLKAIAAKAYGLNGADLANIMNESAMFAVRADKAFIEQEDLQEALKRIVAAPDRWRRLSMRAKSVGKRYSADERVTFADVAGVDEALEELSEVKDYLINPERFTRMGASVPKGVLLSGPPGCGKTLLARAVAGEAHAAFISASGSEFVEVFVGEGAARVRDLFAEARSMAPAIVFIDEIDAVGGRRGSGMVEGGHQEREQTLNQLLVEMDGFDANAQVVVIAATNRPDMLDPALVRAGRFDRKVQIMMPDRKGRRDILGVHARKKPLGPDVDLDKVAGQTQGFSGADLENILNEAALLASRKGLDVIDMQVVDEGIDRAYLGVASKGNIMTDEERRSVAYHEAGHALVAMRAPGARPPYKLTIVPRGGSLGHCSTTDTHDRLVHSRSMLIAQMAVSLGGWACEKLVFGETGSGASSDLHRATDIARKMVCEFGMSDLGPMVFTDFDSNGRPRPPSPEAGKAIDAEIRRLSEEAHEQAVAVLSGERAALDRIVEALLDRETLTAEELEELAGPPPGGGNGRRSAASGRKPATNGRKPAANGRRVAATGAARSRPVAGARKAAAAKGATANGANGAAAGNGGAVPVARRRKTVGEAGPSGAGGD